MFWCSWYIHWCSLFSPNIGNKLLFSLSPLLLLLFQTEANPHSVFSSFCFCLTHFSFNWKIPCPSGFLKSKPALCLFLQVFVPPRYIYTPWSFNSLMGSGSIALLYFIFFSLFFWDNIFDVFCFLSRKTTLIAHIFNFYFFRIILRKIKDLIGKDKTEFETWI